MPPAPDLHIINLLLYFADLSQPDQTHFLDVINAYLYASPQRRTRLRKSWQRDVRNPIEPLEAAGTDAAELGPKVAR